MAILAGSSGIAEAGTAACAKLQRDLASSRSMAPAASGRAARQQTELVRAQAMARNYRCDSALASANCRSLMPTIARMKSNLVRLERGAPSGRGTARGSYALTAALKANGCLGRTGASPQTTAAKANGLFSLFGRRETQEPVAAKTALQEKRPVRSSRRIQRSESQRQSGKPQTVRERSAMASRRSAGGTFRTLCVRTCDGYFFPISFSTTPDHFVDDTAACAARCPGTEVGLYAHRMPDEDVETMVSTLDETPYSDLKTAFLYKLKGQGETKACGCGPVVALATPDSPATTEKKDEPVRLAIAIPHHRPDPLDATDFALPYGMKRTEEPGKRTVRVVGPSFFPDRSAAIFPPAPVHDPAP